MRLSIKNLQICLVLFLPFALVTGPFLADLSISLVGLIFLYILFKEKQFSYISNPIAVTFFLWCIYLLINSLISKQVMLSLESSLFYFRFGLFSLAVWYILENNKNFSKYFAVSFISVFILLLFDGYIQFYFGSNLLGYQYTGGRLGSLFGDELVLGNFLSRLSPLLFAFIALHFSKSQNIFLFAMFLLIATDVLIYIAGERTGFFNLFFSTFIILLLSENWKKVRLITFIISLIAIIIITFSSNTVKERLVNQTLKDLNISTNYKEKSLKEESDVSNIEKDRILFFSTRHEAMAKISLNMFFDKPLIGIGPKLFRFHCGDKRYYVENSSATTSCDTHPHNTFLQILAETGLVGLLLYISLFLWIAHLFFNQFLYLIGFRKDKFLTDFQVCLYAAVCISIWPLIPSMNFFNNWISIIYYLPIGFILHSHLAKNKIN